MIRSAITSSFVFRSRATAAFRRSAFYCSLLIGSALVAPAVHAQSAIEATRTWHIPSGPLDAALTRFAAEAGVNLSFDPQRVAGLQSAGVSGEHTTASALNRLLDGSGLVAERGNGGVFRLKELAFKDDVTLAPVNVAAKLTTDSLPVPYPGGQISGGGRLGMLGNVEAANAPFAIVSFTSETIENQQARTIADVVAWDPSVRSTAPGGDIADAFFIRGFPIGDNNTGEIAFDGLHGVAPNYRLLADYAERIEILKGPAAAIYGMSPNSGVGGTINVVPKRAQHDMLKARVDYATASQAGAHVDFAQRFGDERQFGVRANVGYHDGDTAIDHQSRRGSLGAVALDYRGALLQASLDVIDQKEDTTAPSRRPSISAGLDVPRAPDNENNITQRWEWYESSEQSVLLRAEYELSEGWSVFGGFGLADTEVDRLFNTPSIVNAAGDTRVTPSRAIFDVERESAEAGARGSFATGSVSHQVTVQWSRYEDHLAQATVAGQLYTSNLYQPIERPAQHVAASSFVPTRSETRLNGMAFSDTLGFFDERLQLMLGARNQRVQAENFAASGAKTPPDYDESAVTPMIGVVIKPWERVQFYANYIEGLSKGDTAPTTADNAGETLSPYKAKQKEVGLKVDQGQLTTTLSLFEIVKPSSLLVNNWLTDGGEQRNRGVELSAYGLVAKRFRLFGGATWIDAQLTDTNSALTKGNRAVGVPEWQATFNAEWDVPGLTGFTLNGGLRYSGKQYANQANTQQLPSWTTIDLGARYVTTFGDTPVTWRAALQNATDRDYWAGSSTWGTLIVGSPRTFMLSATADFF